MGGAAAGRRAPGLGGNAGVGGEAAARAGLGPADAELLLPGGARDLCALLFRRHDADALALLSAVDPTTLKVRDRITRAVEARVEAAAADEDAVRRRLHDRPSQRHAQRRP